MGHLKKVDCEIRALGFHPNQRRQEPGLTVNFKEETNILTVSHETTARRHERNATYGKLEAATIKLKQK